MPTNIKRFAPSILLLVLFFVLFMVNRPAYGQTPGITAPSPGSTINGVVIVQGTATDPTFLRYELAFLREDNAGAGWIVFADGDQAVANGTLAVWDTTVGVNVNAPVFPDGRYQLRLRVVRQDFNYDEYFIGNLVIANESAVALPTELPTEPVNSTVPTVTVPFAATATPVPTPTPLNTREVPTLIPTLESAESLDGVVPDVLPTLTPFPTPVPEATVPGQGFTLVESEADVVEDESLLDSIFGFDYSIFGQSFGRGVRWIFTAFLILGLYVFVRNGARSLWRLISSNW